VVCKFQYKEVHVLTALNVDWNFDRAAFVCNNRCAGADPVASRYNSDFDNLTKAKTKKTCSNIAFGNTSFQIYWHSECP
jgi:hypothetical protein